tara:strand:- start:129 stop:530 length:402 start_codon:yes stop_codon:yes gene_type:complete
MKNIFFATVIISIFLIGCNGSTSSPNATGLPITCSLEKKGDIWAEYYYGFTDIGGQYSNLEDGVYDVQINAKFKKGNFSHNVTRVVPYKKYGNDFSHVWFPRWRNLSDEEQNSFEVASGELISECTSTMITPE